MNGVEALKAVYAACGIVVASLAGSGYLFRSSLLLTANPPPVVAQGAKVDLPAGVILIPAGDGICRMHALDNATGQIRLRRRRMLECVRTELEFLDGGNEKGQVRRNPQVVST